MTLGASAASHAQGAPPAPEVAPPPPAGALPPPPPAPPPEVVAAPAPVEARPAADTDFDVNLRRWGIGFAGVSLVPTGAGTATVPALGLRYWLNPSYGVDVALGLSWTGGSTDVAGTSTDKNSVFGVIAQGGIPFVLSAHRHVNFEVIPYLTLAYGLTSTGTGAAETDFNGLRLDVGARAGFEVFFGFIGIPELALSATVGAQFEYQRLNQSAAGTSATDTTLSISTTVQNNPWDIFTGNISARYYF
ncbi:MAG TPA: hypothetical protein VKZ18_04510 [Polyangia bacterium]|nr:hypothetical protein [Polyangia bacterium]